MCLMTTEMCLMCQMCLMTTEMFEENMRNNVVNIVIKASALIGLYYNLSYISIISFINIYVINIYQVMWYSHNILIFLGYAHIVSRVNIIHVDALTENPILLGQTIQWKHHIEPVYWQGHTVSSLIIM